MRRKIISGIVIAVIVAVLAYFVPLPCWVNKTLTGVLWTNGDTSSSETAEVTIRGTYLRYLFRDNTFKGKIAFTGLDTEDYTLIKMELLKGSDNFGSLAYYSSTKNQVMFLGDIRVKGAFKKVVIHLSKKDEYGNWLDEWSDNYISAPAADRQSAVDITKALYGELWEFS